MPLSLATLALLTLTAAAPAQTGPPQLVPLTDLGASTYLGEQGGLYPGGENAPPPDHAAAALHAARSVVPRTADGAPPPDGHVGVLGVGLSNHGQEWRELSRRVDADPQRNGHLVLVDAAVNGVTSDLVRDPQSIFWSILDERLPVCGLTADQVQVAFLETTRTRSVPLPFLDHVAALRDDLGEIVRLLRARFPRLRIVFVSSLTYGGYSVQHADEPAIYESAFAYKRLVEDQIAGDPGLGYDPRSGPVVAPVLVWGPYLWADGATPRSDGLAWLPEDVEPDGFHPSLAGERKVADLYEAFLDASPAERAIFDARPGVTRLASPVSKDAGIDETAPGATLGTLPAFEVREQDRWALLQAELPPFTGIVRHAKLAVEPIDRSARMVVTGVSNIAWDEALVAASTAPARDGPTSATLPLTSKGTLAEWSIGPWVNEVAPRGGPVACAIAGLPGAVAAELVARESGRPAWIGVQVDEAPGGAELFCPGLPGPMGVPATLATLGTTSLGAGDLSFSAADLPPGAVVLPVVGTSHAETALAGGDVSVGGALTRLPLVAADGAGRAHFDVDWLAPPHSVSPGDTRYVQCVFRDVAPAGLRTTSAVVVVFRP